VAEVTTSLSKLLRFRDELNLKHVDEVIVGQGDTPKLSGQWLTPDVGNSGRELTDRVHTEQAHAEAQRIVEAAEQEAEQILLFAKVGSERAMLDARNQGYEAGYAAGITQGQQAVEHTIATATTEAAAIVTIAMQARKDLLTSLSTSLGGLVTGCVRRLLYRELTVSAVDVDMMVTDVLQYVLASHHVEIRVHPSDFEVATASHPRWQTVKFGEWDIAIVPDISMSPGDCMVRTESGRVDATLAVRLHLLDEAIQQSMERSVGAYVLIAD